MHEKKETTEMAMNEPSSLSEGSHAISQPMPTPMPTSMSTPTPIPIPRHRPGPSHDEVLSGLGKPLHTSVAASVSSSSDSSSHGHISSQKKTPKATSPLLMRPPPQPNPPITTMNKQFSANHQNANHNYSLILGYLLALALVASSLINLAHRSPNPDEIREHVTRASGQIQESLMTLLERGERKAEEYRLDMREKMEAHVGKVGVELQGVRREIANMELSLTRLELQTKTVVTTQNALQIINAALDERQGNEAKIGCKELQSLSLDDVRNAAKKVLQVELEKHAADGVGRVDYALASGGGRVMAHSEIFKGTNPNLLAWSIFPWNLIMGNKVKNKKNLLPENEILAAKVLQPSFGEPGQCLPLAGSNVYVDVALRNPIYPQDISLEHVSKTVAYDISSAPKDFHIYGQQWLGSEDWVLLGNFTYDIDDQAVQIFPLIDREEKKNIFHMIRLHVLSNYGSPSHTCIYRIRVHGTDPKSVVPLSK